MTDEEWQHVRWRVRDDGSIDFELRVDERGRDLVTGALAAAHAELDRTCGPVPGGLDAPTPEAERRRRDAIGLVVKRVARALEVGFRAERSGERSTTATSGSARKS